MPLPFETVAQALEELEPITGRIQMTNMLAALLKQAGPDEIAVNREDMDAVGVALAALTDEQRETIALRFFAGLSAREAAEAMGKQEGTIRGLQFRAIAALRRELGVAPEPEPEPPQIRTVDEPNRP